MSMSKTIAVEFIIAKGEPNEVADTLNRKNIGTHMFLRVLPPELE